MSAGPSQYAPIPPSHAHANNMGGPMSLQPQLFDLTGKPNTAHMGGQPVRAPLDRKVRGPVPVAPTGPAKRTTRGPRSATARMPSMQAPGPNAYAQQPTAPPPHAVYNPQNFNQWLPGQSMPGPQQSSMAPGYVNPNQIKQQMSMQNVRPAGVVNRPGVGYPNQPMQQQSQPPQPQQQQAPGQGQIPMSYMPEQTSMMMTPSGMPAGPPNGNRPGVAVSGKRKLGEAAMFSNEQPQYATPSKMSLPSSGELVKRR